LGGKGLLLKTQPMSEQKLTPEAEAMIEKRGNNRSQDSDFRFFYKQGATHALTDPDLLKAQGLYTREEVIDIANMLLDHLGYGFARRKDFIDETLTYLRI
jgi:hypothetical protein